MAVTDAPERPGYGQVLRDTIFTLMGRTRTTQSKLASELGLHAQSGLSKRLRSRDPVPFTELHLEALAAFFRLDSPADLYDPERALSLCRERFPMSRCFTVPAGQGTLFAMPVAA